MAAAHGESDGIEEPLANSLKKALSDLRLAVERSSPELYESMNASKDARQTGSKAGALSSKILSMKEIKAAPWAGSAIQVPSSHSVLFYHIALSIKTCHMLMADLSTYDMFAFLKENGYVDG